MKSDVGDDLKEPNNANNIAVTTLGNKARILPKSGGNVGNVTVRVYLPTSFPLSSGAQVKLNAAGQPDVTADKTEVVNKNVLAAVFNLSGVAAGIRDVVVTNPDGTQYTLPSAFTIESGGSPDLWVDVVGPSRIRINSEVSYFLTYGNKGNVNAYDVPLWIAFPKGTAYKLYFDITPPPTLEGEPPVDWSQVPDAVGIGDEIALPLLLPVVRAGQTVSIRFSLQGEKIGIIPVRAWIGSMLYQPPLPQDFFRETAVGIGGSRTAHGLLPLQSSPGGYSEAECVAAFQKLVFNEVLSNLSGLIPGSDCAKEAALQINKQTIEMYTLIANASSDTLKENDQVESLVEIGTGIAKTVFVCAADINPESAFLKTLLKTWELFDKAKTAYSTATACSPPLPPILMRQILVVTSVDPNDKVGSQGSGDGHYVSGEEPLRYFISFENKPEASAPAQEVIITDPLDPQNLDLSTLSLGPITFGNKVITPPPGLNEYSEDVDLRPQVNLIARVHARLDPASGVLTWRFTSLDSETKKPTQDPLAGFLPPNRTPPEGDGSVFFTIQPRPGLATGTEIHNKARIVFDTNAPIDTPDWLNTLDNSAPLSTVQSLGGTQSSPQFEVKWAGTDEGAGIKAYSIYVSENGDPFELWGTTNESSHSFVGQPGSTYAFYSVAEDEVGNREPKVSPAVVTTRIPAIQGDVNLDQTVDVTDVVLVLRYIVGVDALTDVQKTAADMNQDQAVDVSDAVAILKVIVGVG